MQQSRHLRRKVLRRQGLLGNNGLSCWSRLLQYVRELRAGGVCLHVWAPRRLELRALNGNINANQPFNLYKRNRGRRGRLAAAAALLTCGCECGRCSIRLYRVFFSVCSPPGGGDVDNHPLRTFTAASKQPCLCLDGGIIAPPALGDPRRARPSRSKQFSGRREARGCLIWRWYREMFHPAKATSDTMWQHRTWSPSKQWKLLFIFFYISARG